MAKKKSDKHKVEDVELDDMKEFEDDFDLGGMDDFDDERSPSKAGVAKELGKEASKGFLDGLVKTTARKSLPSEYTDNYQTAVDYVDFGREIAGSSRSKISRSLYGLGKEVKKILPFQSKMLDRFLENHESSSEKERRQTEEEMRNASIDSSLANIFDKQLEVQKALQARTEAKDEVDTKREMVLGKLQSDILSNMDKNIAQQSAFTVQIGKEYYRKSLELQYKSYYVLGDLLHTTKDHFKAFSVQFDSMVKNTGLPDFVKLRSTERLTEMIRNQALESVEQRLFSNNKYVTGIKKRIGDLVDNKVNSVTDKIQDVTDALGNITSISDSPGSTMGLMGNILSGTLGGTLGEKVAAKIPKGFKDRIGNNRFVKAGASSLSSLANSPRSFFSGLRRDNQDALRQAEEKSGPLGSVERFIRRGVGGLLEATKADSFGGTVKDSSVLSHNQPAIFDNKVHRSITEVIPMYLSQILKENADLRGMYGTVNKDRLKGFVSSEVKVYNYGDRKLSTLGDYREYIENKVLGSKDTEAKTKSLASSLLNEAKGKLQQQKAGREDISVVSDKGSQELLSSYLQAASKVSGVDKDYATLIDKASKGEGNPQLVAMVQSNSELKKVLTAMSKVTDGGLRSNFGDRLSDVGEVYPIAPVKSLFEQAAKIAGSKFKNALTNKQAGIISKAFATYMHNPAKFGGRDDVVLPQDIAQGRLTTAIPKKDIGDVKVPLSIFVSDVSSIVNGDDMMSKEALKHLVGRVCSAIDNNINQDVEVFQLLRELNPELVKTGSITIENMHEGKLSGSEDIDFVTMQEAKQIGNVSGKDLLNQRTGLITEAINSRLISSSIRSAARFTNEMRETGGNPVKVVQLITKTGKDVIIKGRIELKQGYDKLSKMSGELKELGIDFAAKVTSDSLSKFNDKLAQYSLEINKLRAAEMNKAEEAVRKLEDLKDQIEENMDVSTRDIDKEIELITAAAKEKVKILDELKGSIDKTRNDLEANVLAMMDKATDTKDATVNLARQVRETLSRRTAELRDILTRAEVVEESIGATV